MKIVSLVCTFHAERGKTSVYELYKILERIHPEVIFLEAPSVLFRDQFEIGNLDSLESRAVLRYLEAQSADLVPVDLPTPETAFFRKAEELFSQVEKASYEYCRLIDQNKDRMFHEGFSYLNSESNEKHHSDLHEEILRVIESRASNWMAEAYKEWRHTIELRDMKMLANIERYSRENKFSRAAFLVGAAHRSSIVNKTRERAPSESTEIRWEYSDNVTAD